MSRLAAIGLSIALAGAAPAPEISQTVPKPAPPQTASPSGVEHILLLLGDAQARMTVPVSIGTTGPYNFIVDTGSERSVVSRELAGQLNLAAGSTEERRVGKEWVRTCRTGWWRDNKK